MSRRRSRRTRTRGTQKHLLFSVGSAAQNNERRSLVASSMRRSAQCLRTHIIWQCLQNLSRLSRAHPQSTKNVAHLQSKASARNAQCSARILQDTTQRCRRSALCRCSCYRWYRDEITWRRIRPVLHHQRPETARKGGGGSTRSHCRGGGRASAPEEVFSWQHGASMQTSHRQQQLLFQFIMHGTHVSADLKQTRGSRKARRPGSSSPAHPFQYGGVHLR